MKRWLVIHLPTNQQREMRAPSSAMAIALSGWPVLDTIAQECR